MRIAESTKRVIQNRILTDLYSSPKEALEQRKSEIARKNREYELAPYMELINKLPKELIAHTHSYLLKINYQMDAESPENQLTDTWRYDTEVTMINFKDPKEFSYRAMSLDGTLDKRLYVEAAQLAQDIISLRKENNEMEAFLSKTLLNHSGPAQLRKVWPEYLHKYLPAVKAKAPRKRVEKEDIAVPEALKTRLTTNLLEGN